MINTASYSSMGIWELAARHSVAREHRDYPQCNLIQNEVDKRPSEQRKIIKQLNYYQPIENVEVNLFNN